MALDDLNFKALKLEGEVEWPQRGRKARPLPAELVQALHASFEHGSTPHLVVPNDQVKYFYTLLAKCGSKLNYRIEKHTLEDQPKAGASTVYFRVRNRRKNAESE